MFGQGLETFTDPNKTPLGKFDSLVNTTFIKSAEGDYSALNKRNGFGIFPKSIGTISYLTTFNDNLVGVARTTILGQAPSGASITSYAEGIQSWVSSGSIAPLQLDTQSMIKNTYSQSGCDAAVAPNGLVCVTYNTGELSPVYRYAILNPNTGQYVVSPTAVTASGGSEIYPPRVFCFGDKFVLAYDVWNLSYTTSSVYHLQLLTIPSTAPSSIGSVTTISSGASYSANGTSYRSFDATIASSEMFFSWQKNGGGISAAKLSPTMVRSSIVQISSATANIVSNFSDTTVGSNSTIYTICAAGSSTTLFAVATDANLVTKFSTASNSQPNTLTYSNLTGAAQRGFGTAFMEVNFNYSYDITLKSQRISTLTISSSGSLGAESYIARSIGLASKAFIVNSFSCFLGAYDSTYQPTYFLLNNGGSVLSRFAYGNGGGYYDTVGGALGASSLNVGLPNVSLSSNSYYISYLFKNQITSVNKSTNVSSTDQTVGIYSTLGVNLAQFTYTDSSIVTKELGNNLNINGGFLWSYDGLRATENNFFVYPDDVKTTVTGTVGAMTAQTYFYSVTYQYIDNQGNIYRSAPSIPVAANVAEPLSAVTVRGPTLRLTYKSAPNYPTLNIYRWSAAQPVFYAITPPVVQDSSFTSAESFSVQDTKTDAQILGNEILYTTGGVLENSAAPATNAMTVFDQRLWLVDAENPDLLRYSKQVIEGVPVEMSDFLTYFVAPNAGTQNPTGPIKSIAPMDDKLIVFKRNAILYINGKGPDNTGANNQYSEPIFINGTIGCSNPSSVVLIPNGLMFKSDNGIWLLGRDLALKYVGKDVEDFNSATVLSSVYVPGTSEVRFNLSTGEVLVYDYLVDQWSSDTNASALSSTIYKNLHTYVNSSNSVFQETVGIYQDGTTPTTMSFTTGWIDFPDLQGYARLYSIYLLGTIQSAHQFRIGLAYDYNPTVVQTAIVNPTNTIGSGSQVEQWQINPIRQQCQAVQLSFTEVSSVSAGAGISISGLNMVVGVKKSYPQNIPPRNRIS